MEWKIIQLSQLAAEKLIFNLKKRIYENWEAILAPLFFGLKKNPRGDYLQNSNKKFNEIYKYY